MNVPVVGDKVEIRDHGKWLLGTLGKVGTAKKNYAVFLNEGLFKPVGGLQNSLLLETTPEEAVREGFLRKVVSTASAAAAGGRRSRKNKRRSQKTRRSRK